jgi:hypothetical protein
MEELNMIFFVFCTKNFVNNSSYTKTILKFCGSSYNIINMNIKNNEKC